MSKRQNTIKELETVLGIRSEGFSSDEMAELFTSEKVIKGYYPEVAKIFNNDIHIAIFLTQVAHRWYSKGRAPFHKFNSDCETSLNGDSWEEDLAMTYRQLYNIKAVVCTRVRSRAAAIELSKTGTAINTLVVCYQDSNRITYWFLNEGLFNKLRATAIEKFPNYKWKKSKDTNLPKRENEQSSDSEDSSYSNTSSNIKEKEINKEKEKSFIFEEKGKKISRKPATDKKKAKVKETANKPRIETTPVQQSFIEDKVKGKTLPLDFFPDKSIMGKLVDEGYVYEDLVPKVQEMVTWIHAKNPSMKMVDWGLRFLAWIHNDKRLLKNGKPAGKDANTERLNRLAEMASSSAFDRIGTRDSAKIAAMVREMHYGNGRDSNS